VIHLQAALAEKTVLADSLLAEMILANSVRLAIQLNPMSLMPAHAYMVFGRLLPSRVPLLLFLVLKILLMIRLAELKEFLKRCLEEKKSKPSPNKPLSLVNHQKVPKTL